MTHSVKDLVQITAANSEEVAAMLGRAFHDDPLISHFLPEGEERKLKAPCFFEFLLRYVLKYGEAYATTDKIEGAALWLPSEHAEMTMEKMGAAGCFELAAQIGMEVLEAMGPFFGYVYSRHALNAPFPHSYLMVIGVDPSSQGQGCAGTLLSGMLARLDGEKKPCYLETQKEKNVAFYEHFGFALVEKVVVPGSEVNMWNLLRKQQDS